MTILFLARRFYPLIGGVEKHVLEISERLIHKGHKVIVLTEQIEGLEKFERLPSGIEIVRFYTGAEGKSKKLHIWQELWKIKSILESADVVHCHDVFYWYLPFRLLYPRKPVYTTFHGYESFPIKKSAIRMRKLSEKLSWGNICIGDFIKKWYGTKPSLVSYGAVAPVEKNLKQSKIKIESALFIGRLDDQTGILTYAAAIDVIKKNNPKFSLTAIGDGEYKKRIAKKVSVLGFQKNPERNFSKYHFAFVSRYLAILEAFAAKKLVLAVYDNPVKEDYLKLAPFAEFIVIAKTPQELSESVTYYLKHPDEEKKMVDKAYRWVQKQTWDVMVQNYLSLWKK